MPQVRKSTKVSPFGGGVVVVVVVVTVGGGGPYVPVYGAKVTAGAL